MFQISREILSELVRPPTRPLLPSDSSSSSDDDLDDEDVDLGSHIYPSSNFVNFDIPEGLITVLECS